MARTLLVQRWSFHTARVRAANRQEFPPWDVQGVDLVDFLHGQLAATTHIDDSDRQRWVTVGRVEGRGARSLLVSASAGKYGEAGDVVDRTSGTVAFTLGEDHAATVPTRSLVIVPDTGMSALAFYERSTGRGASGVDLAKYLHAKWRAQDSGTTWVQEWVEESDAWLEAAQMKSVEVRRYAGQRGVAGAAASSLGEFTFGARAGRSRFLPRSDLEHLLSNPKHAHSIIGHISPEDGDRVFVKLSADGREKTYALTGGSLPRVQEEIKPDLSDDAFVGECVARASGGLASRVGMAWQSAWVA